MNNLQQCHSCGGMFPDEAMADWTICRGCMIEQAEQMRGEPVYMDSLGICWTESELEAAGGKAEVDKMAFDADARNHSNQPIITNI